MEKKHEIDEKLWTTTLEWLTTGVCWQRGFGRPSAHSAPKRSRTTGVVDQSRSWRSMDRGARVVWNAAFPARLGVSSFTDSAETALRNVPLKARKDCATFLQEQPEQFCDCVRVWSVLRSVFKKERKFVAVVRNIELGSVRSSEKPHDWMQIGPRHTGFVCSFQPATGPALSPLFYYRPAQSSLFWQVGL